jgi:hypothetical protein
MNILTRLVPYIFLGIILVVFVLGIILFSYLLILGGVVGLILFVIQWVRERLFKSKQLIKPRGGRTFDHKK